MGSYAPQRWPLEERGRSLSGNATTSSARRRHGTEDSPFILNSEPRDPSRPITVEPDFLAHDDAAIASRLVGQNGLEAVCACDREVYKHNSQLRHARCRVSATMARHLQFAGPGALPQGDATARFRFLRAAITSGRRVQARHLASALRCGVRSRAQGPGLFDLALQPVLCAFRTVSRARLLGGTIWPVASGWGYVLDLGLRSHRAISPARILVFTEECLSTPISTVASASSRTPARMRGGKAARGEMAGHLLRGCRGRPPRISR